MQITVQTTQHCPNGQRNRQPERCVHGFLSESLMTQMKGFHRILRNGPSPSAFIQKSAKSVIQTRSYGKRETADGGRWTEDAETPCALRLKPKLPPSWPSCNPPKSWFRQSSKAPQGQTKPTTARRASRNKIPVNSLGLKIRATSCTSLNHANHSSDNAAMRSWQTKPTTTRRPEYNSGQQSRIENPSYIKQTGVDRRWPLAP